MIKKRTKWLLVGLLCLALWPAAALAQSDPLKDAIDRDQAVQESMGAITDHTFERLAPSDQMITHVRRRLIRAARAFKKTGKAPPAAANHMDYAGVRGGHFQAPEKSDWLKAYRTEVAKAPNVLGQAEAAE